MKVEGFRWVISPRERVAQWEEMPAVHPRPGIWFDFPPRISQAFQPYGVGDGIRSGWEGKEMN